VIFSDPTDPPRRTAQRTETDMSTAAPPRHTARPCPICSRMSLAAHHPFCSDRCRKVDLNRWLSGVYAIPAADPADDDFDDPPAPR
jgi:endogenous inhibitor of DNA gyrase (YacG/DUF329 family)